MKIFSFVYFSKTNVNTKSQKNVGRKWKNIFFIFLMLYIHQKVTKKTMTLIIFWKLKMMTRPIRICELWASGGVPRILTLAKRRGVWMTRFRLMLSMDMILNYFLTWYAIYSTFMFLISTMLCQTMLFSLWHFTI